MTCKRLIGVTYTVTVAIGVVHTRRNLVPVKDPVPIKVRVRRSNATTTAASTTTAARCGEYVAGGVERRNPSVPLPLATLSCEFTVCGEGHLTCARVEIHVT